MTWVVLSIGSNLGDRLARLQSVVDGLGETVLAVSPVYETDPWGRVDQAPFLNAVLIANDPACDGQCWLRRAQEFERAAGRVRGERWGPRTLDVDLIACYGEAEVISRENNLTLPHPLAHLRAFVMIPWLAIDPDAQLTVAGDAQPVSGLLAQLDPADRESVRLTDLKLHRPGTDPADRSPEG
ncbi:MULTISPECIES: 2-amino-4-hydroxy-6-hydroxymethyldihydropteridine diphosphokinase [unclassified Mycobacterium]|uniref:2-amino-4-hydroxy-6- hydroxymethyldihydropteridine diphosphokinase n=1 Tax=unclassified Mycobacterium TaxID=2642494 RepID=UPI0007FE70A8|nr:MULTISPECIES: 2-amino-4-hydroxy-6-hydroxymethyldihydropteridine diphosphokinase [unclassified Mycobacterium]OBG54633.1 2-amino-4-hydroxy-6-hydroxymethyldihydropteridine diphosphokinase [Mycobacterium sp. E188]OBG55916.1 2-amino-4-hydroxy-6-hydroxymethyldihydropteridine diphosphokinase [Mycobacterium sp. E735]OBG71723.1 2-amino-4-hydroxy-6-hydroxymethyldihydropteridine diphosphokinase [Mycobacterium sp. E3305]OBG86051.1 2-amino-4-hydroxy-6-hydroxymethyldihydropteridine diphosphokinase [Mycoba